MKAHVSDVKKKEVNNLKELLSKYPIVGIVNLTGLPALQFQNLRSQLKDKVFIRVTKKRLIRKAFELVKDKKPKIEEFEKDLDKCMPALMFTSEDPFKLANILNKNKSPAPAKAGQTAPKDIVVQAGPTSFTPGPILGELGASGIKSGVVNGKIEIKEDKLLVKKGAIITQKQADILAKLGIQPMEIGLNLVSIYQDGQIFPSEVLFIDEEEYLNNIKQAYIDSLGLAITINYLTKETVPTLIKKAYLEAKALLDNTDILTGEKMPKLLAKAESEASNINSKLDIKSDNKEKPKLQNPSPYSKEDEDKAKELLKNLQDKKMNETSGG